MLQGLPNINIDDDAGFWQSLVDVAFHNSDVKVKGLMISMPVSLLFHLRKGEIGIKEKVGELIFFFLKLSGDKGPDSYLGESTLISNISSNNTCSCIDIFLVFVCLLLTIFFHFLIQYIFPWPAK